MEKAKDPEKDSSSWPPNEVRSLSDDHREYLMQRHGTVDLDPMPSADPADPYNWPKSKKEVHLALVAFHALMATFTAAALSSALVPMAHDLHVSLQRASYIISLAVAVQGCAPLLWRPLANRYGRRPIFLLSLICSLAGNVGCAKSPTYGTMVLCRVISAFFISPAAAIGTAVVSETFFKHERGTYMGIWTVMVTCGVPTGPFLFGFVAQRVNYRWIYWILAMVNGIQLMLGYLFSPETLYMRDAADTPVRPNHWWCLNFRPIDPRPLTLLDIVYPFRYILSPRVCFPAISYAMIFLWASVMPTNIIPQIFPVKFHLNVQQIGLQFLSVIIGSLIGEQMGGRVSDWWMYRYRRNKTGPDSEKAPPRRPEHRLWLAYLGFVLSIIGVVVFLVQVGRAGSNWNITPLVGVTIACVGKQLITTVLITYAVDCYRTDAAAVGVFIVFVRQIWGFIGPFWLPNLIRATSFNSTAGIATASLVILSICPIAWLHIFAS